MASNLPNWPGADTAYSRAYRLLAHMARNGHVTPARKSKDGRRQLEPGTVSEEMRDLITALNKGDEEYIKGVILQNIAIVPEILAMEHQS